MKDLNKIFPLDLDSRFWKDKKSFFNSGYGSVVYLDGELASICYSAAIFKGIAEIDIYSRTSLRKRGLAKIAAKSFINQCYEKNIIPNWDCFQNNIPSVFIAKSLGFKVVNEYSFYTIYRNK